MQLNKIYNALRHVIIKQNSSVHLCDNIIEIQRQNTFAELILSKRHSETACVAVLYGNHSISIRQRSLLCSFGSNAIWVVMLHNIVECSVNGFDKDSFHRKSLSFLIKNTKMLLKDHHYTRDADGNFIIDPKEADVIRLIFSYALSGMGTYKIAQMLEKRKIPTRKGGKWAGSTVKGILVNEKYYGAAAFQKTYTDSNFQRHHNHGEVDSFYAEEHHEPLISKEAFDKVQLLLQKHAEERKIEKNIGKYHKKYPFSGRIVCGECGDKFKRQTQSVGIAWACTTHLYDKASCSMKFIKDAAIKAAFVTMLNKLIFGYKFILFPYLDALKLSDADNNLLNILDIKAELQKNTDRKQDLRKLRVSGFLDSVMYTQELRQIEKQNEEYRTALKNQERTAVNGSIKETEKLIRFIETFGIQSEFSDEVFTEYVDSIIVYSRICIGFRLNCGLTLKEELCTGTE